MRSFSTKLSAALALAGAISVAGVAVAGPVLGILNPASPAHYVGPCPGTIKFTGWISSSIQGPVKYQWFRSDGATGPVETLFFEKAGRRPISTTWTLGGPGLPSYAGWEAVHILSPAGADSNKAFFTLKCVQRPLTHG